MDSVESFYAPNRKAWREWLEKNHDKKTGVWLIHDKGEHRTMSWEDIVQEALCFGWIDSVAGKVSDTQSKIYVSKRKPKSAWSKINKAHVERLIEQGLMTPAGLAAIELAKQNGSWDLLNKSDNLEYPPELTALLKENPTAQQHFEAFTPSAKRIILEWIYQAKRPETRLNRIQKTVMLAKENKKSNQ